MTAGHDLNDCYYRFTIDTPEDMAPSKSFWLS